MIADLFGRHVAGVPGVAAKVHAVRPMAGGLLDDFPYLVYETSGLTQLNALSRPLPWYEGTISLHVCVREYADANVIAEAIKTTLPGTQAAGDGYQITRIKFDDEADVAAVGEGESVDYYVKVLHFWVRARRT